MRALILSVLVASIFFACDSESDKNPRNTVLFTDDWKFHLGDAEGAQAVDYDDRQWRELDLPHDWSIEGEFSKDHPATAGGGALPGGIGWYRKTFTLNESESSKLFTIRFDGVYCNSEVWINGNYLGKRPNGYIAFQYDLTQHLNFGSKPNVLIVKVANDPQPNSRWYSGSGIYRNVWLISKGNDFIEETETFISTPVVGQESATVNIATTIKSINSEKQLKYHIEITGPDAQKVVETTSDLSGEMINVNLSVPNPKLWSVESPNLYKAVIKIFADGKLADQTSNVFGIRYFEFHPDKGFSLNGKTVKIKGVCNHHDLGCLGAAINTRALERQLEIMKKMGVNAIRTAHNPPAPELLELCDKMGFLVMDEMFDFWKKGKNKHDYHLDWDEWHVRDLQDFIKRDRNHPSIIVWSVGNEILEQWDTTGIALTKELVEIVKALDTSREITVACNPPTPDNNLMKAGVIDLIGYNYAHERYEGFSAEFPGKCFIATETTSALATRGYYENPSDTIRRWPIRWDRPFTEGNADNTVSAYDHVSTPWGSTHEETWKIIKKHQYMSGMFVWTGFDYLGEPTPYGWPSRSSYFGIVDLAGFPKDSYYMYKSEWTGEDVLHVFPHWNWAEGDVVDIWTYSSAEVVELFLNGQSLGKKTKGADDLHLMWRVPFEKGTITARSYDGERMVLEKEMKTAGSPVKIVLTPDRSEIGADGRDLSFVTVSVQDAENTVNPQTDDLINFEVEGPGKIVGVDNGDPTSHLSLKGDKMKAFHGLCLVVVQSTGGKGEITLKASSEKIEAASVVLKAE